MLETKCVTRAILFAALRNCCIFQAKIKAFEMGIADIVLFPFYVYIFHLIFKASRKKLSPLLQYYQKTGFWIKVAATLAITVFNLYISPGDSTYLYYPEGHNIFKLILQDQSHIDFLLKTGKEINLDLIFNPMSRGYFNSEANYLVIKLVAFFSFFTFGRYLLINLFFSMVAFSGIWRLFLFFYELYPHLHKRAALAVLYLPTVVFWSSGILKDPIAIGMLGWLTFSMYKLILKNEGQVQNAIIATFSAWILFIVKPYILFSFLPFLVLYLVLKNLTYFKSPFIKFAIFAFITGTSVAGFMAFSEELNQEMGAFSVDNLTESVQGQQDNFEAMADRAGSSFKLGVEFDGSGASLLKIAPAAINATLFRPYIWESKKISTLLSSLESLSLMIFTLYVFFKVGPWQFFKTIFRDPMILFCFFFSITFALFIGTTTLNFGTLVRYKIPCMPFYLMALFLVLDSRIKKQKALQKSPVILES